MASRPGARRRALTALTSSQTGLAKPALTMVGIGAVAAWAAPTAFAATEVGVTPAEPERGDPYALVSARGDGERNEIVVRYRGGEFVISDPAGVEPTDENCVQITPIKARCRSPEGPSLTIFAAVGWGSNDQITVDDGVRSQASLLGAGGKDLLTGGSRGDFLGGNRGADILRGRRGRDTLSSGSDYGGGADRLVAGPGDDTVSARNGSRQAFIDCGAGDRDLVRFDRRLDPRPQRCENDRMIRASLEDGLLEIGGGADGDGVRVDRASDGSATVVATGRIVPSGGCFAISQRRVRCFLQVRRIAIDGGRGGDQLDLSAVTEAEAKIVGGSGNDRLIGGLASDRLFGGGGRDQLVADDGVADQVIDCGPGRPDTARIDQLDARPLNCERRGSS